MSNSDYLRCGGCGCERLQVYIWWANAHGRKERIFCCDCGEFADIIYLNRYGEARLQSQGNLARAGDRVFFEVER